MTFEKPCWWREERLGWRRVDVTYVSVTRWKAWRVVVEVGAQESAYRAPSWT